MTREEAINYLQPIADSASLPRYAEALNMAISALREQNVTDINVGNKTNADRIRSMTDEELAELLARETFRIAKPCFDAFGYGLEEQVIYARRLDWLKQPFSGGE